MRRVIATVVLALTLAGCGGDSTGPEEEAHLGTWVLQSVNGTNLPAFVASSQGVTLTALSGALRMRADGTADFTYRYRFTQGTSVREEDSTGTGNYTRIGNSIQISWESGATSGTTEFFTLDDGTLTFTSAGLTYLFRR